MKSALAGGHPQAVDGPKAVRTSLGNTNTAGRNPLMGEKSTLKGTITNTL